MAITVGYQVFHPGHGWVPTFESCDCAECTAGQEKDKGSGE